MNRFYRSIVFYVLILLIIVGAVDWLTSGDHSKKPITYSEFVQDVKSGSISGQVVVTPEGLTATIDGTLKDNTNFETRALLDDNLYPLLTTNHVDFTVNPQPKASIWINFLESVVPFVFVFILMFFLFNQAQGGGSRVMNFGKSRARLYSEEKRRVTFRDVAGADEEKAELEEIVEFLKDL